MESETENKPHFIDVASERKILKFGHSGDLGDVIYALPTIEAICQRENAMAHIVLYRGPGVRECFDEERFCNIQPLLSKFPFVRECTYWAWPMQDGDVDYDFADWRNYYVKSCKGKGNLATTPAEFFRVDPAVVNKPWITGLNPLQTAISATSGGIGIPRTVVVARSHRYRDPEFPWRELAERYRDRAVVVGTKSEMEELAYHYGFYAQVRTPSLLQAAQIIEGAELVITNQTCIYAITEAMKKPAVLEEWPECPNVRFDRPDVWSGKRVQEFLDGPDPIAPVDSPAPMQPRPAISGVKKSA